MTTIPPLLASPAILPPFVGTDPTAVAARAPYQSTIEDFIRAFGTSDQRRKILAGLLKYRRLLRRLNLAADMQWLAGSFVEDPGREPRDVDVVTFYTLTGPEARALVADPGRRTDLAHVKDHDQIKAEMLCDSYLVNLIGPAQYVVRQTHYWYGLFGHQRGSFAWKGFVEVSVVSADDDASAEKVLTSLVTP